MSHYVFRYREHETDNFRKFWSRTAPYKQDGCCSFVQVGPENHGNCTKASIAKAKASKELSYPGSYSVRYIDCGIVGWEVHRQVRKKVAEYVKTLHGLREERHIREVTEVKRYKSKPTRILKGGTLHATHHYVFSYDGRCYEYGEHGCSGITDEWNNY